MSVRRLDCSRYNLVIDLAEVKRMLETTKKRLTF